MDLIERPTTAVGVRHPWEQARRRLVTRVLKEELRRRPLPPTTALDIGSGDAWLADALAQDLNLSLVHAVDIGYTDEDCRALRTERVRPTRAYPDERADLVLLLDVIEHVEDDAELLRIARDHLSEEGIVMVTVPAWPRLSTQHDYALGHHRRYTPQRLRQALSNAGLVESRMGSAFSSLLAVRAVQRILERAYGPRHLRNLGDWNGSAMVTEVLAAVLAWDAEFGRRIAARDLMVPGLTLWTTAVPAA